jgi:hypothetical protein
MQCRTPNAEKDILCPARVDVLQLAALAQILGGKLVTSLHGLLHPVLRDTHGHWVAAGRVLRRLPLTVEKLSLEDFAGPGEWQDSTMDELG